MASVKTTKKFSVYWNYQVWALAEGETVSGGLADYLLETSSPVERLDEPAEAPADPDAVPDGTIQQVLDWVGGDPAKADLALLAEYVRDAPQRTTLVAALEKLAIPTPTT